MDLTFLISAIIFTLLAIVVATSLFNDSSSTADFPDAGSPFGHRGDGASGQSDRCGPKQNGHVPDKKKKKKTADDWCEISGSSHDHWDVVKSVLSRTSGCLPVEACSSPVNTQMTFPSVVGQVIIQEEQHMQEEAYPNPHTGEVATQAEHSSSTSSLSVPRPGSRNMSLEGDSSSEASSGRRSFIGLSDKELLKCAFSHPQTEGATESPEVNDDAQSNDLNSLKYIPGKARSHHLQMMLSKDELEEEQRVQREQLSTIFQLLKDNKETFGDVSEGDMEEQLRLYSI